MASTGHTDGRGRGGRGIGSPGGHRPRGNPYRRGSLPIEPEAILLPEGPSIDDGPDCDDHGGSLPSLSRSSPPDML
ncbi:hypothetical protein U1Q18_037452 [Sarracenia purpurea var. burkii]